MSNCELAVYVILLTVDLQFIGESREGRMADALAHGGDEGRDKLR